MNKIKWQLKKLQKADDDQKYILNIQKGRTKINGVLTQEQVRQITGFFDNRI